MSPDHAALVALFSGFAMIGFGLSPLAGTTFRGGVSERGCAVALGGIAIVTLVAAWKVIN